MSINTILDYYCKYENITRFMQNSLNEKDGQDYNIRTLYDIDKVQGIINHKKTSRIYQVLKKECADITSEAKWQIMNLIEGKADEEDFVNVFKFEYEENKKRVKTLIKEIVTDNEIIICYPIVQKGNIKQPIITFVCEIKEQALKVKDYYINRESIKIILAFLLKCSIEEVDDIAEKDLKEIFDISNQIQSQNDIDEIISIIDVEVFKRFKSENIHSILDFKVYDGWIKVEKIFITSETLDEMYTPIFKEEISIIKDKHKKNNAMPDIVKKYILGNECVKHYEEVKNRFKFHFGSYTDEYPINEKQWQVVGNKDDIQLLSVNGPPGTGKTTLLKEIIADNMVNKAKQLIEVWDDEWIKINNNSKQEVYMSPFEGSNKNSIVISSTNNLAVDNIGEELLKEIAYFSEFMVGNDETEYQGMLCARLGKNENRDFFIVNMLKPLIESLKSLEDYTNNKELLEQFNAKHQELNTIRIELDKLFDAKRHLMNLLQLDNFTEQSLMNVLDNIKLELQDSKEKLATLEINIDDENKKLLSNRKDINTIEQELHQLINNHEEMNRLIKQYYIDLDKFDNLKKFRFLKIFSKKIRAYFNEYPTRKYIEKQIEKTEEKMAEKELNIENLKKRNEIVSKCIIETQESLEGMKNDKNRLENEKRTNEKLREEIEEFIAMFSSITKTLEYKGTYSDDIYKLANCKRILTLRKQLFNMSLKVYEEYIKKHRKAIFNNLEKIIEDDKWFKSFYSSDQSFRGRFKKGVEVLWETFFICFPVVTTTLHSFGKKTFQILPNIIDLLLIDEAGQILPHYLVGPLYRARRAIVVGDTEQLEPIRLYNKDLITNSSDVPEHIQWRICVENNSAQHYSDNNSDIYDILNNKNKGIILDEHRRCEKSIVEFSNIHVYEGKLNIFKDDNHDKLFGRNLVAIDIRGKKTTNHINKSEVQACKRVVELLIDKYGDVVKKDIAIITPFKNQGKELKKVIKDIDIGTIHTFQGQEKKYIIISTVLDTEKSTRLLNFLGGKANLLNVSLTRAKEQVILVGNIEVAFKRKNYLQKVVKTIQDKGLVYSIFDADISSKDEKMEWEKALKVISDTEFNTQLRLGQYLKENFEDNIIIGSQKHNMLLKKIFMNAERSIYIFSPWITNHVVDNELKLLIEETIARNVDMKICFGYKKSNYNKNQLQDIVQVDYTLNDNGKKNIFDTIGYLNELLKDNLIYRPPIHTKMILVDDEFLFIGSHNWLSNSGKSEEKDEISCILTNKSTIKYVNEKYIESFT